MMRRKRRRRRRRRKRRRSHHRCMKALQNWWQRWDSNPHLRRDWCLKPHKIFVSAVHSGVSASSISSQGKKAFQTRPRYSYYHKTAPSHRLASRKLIMRVV